MTELDDVDRRLIAALQADGRASMRLLAETLHVSRATVYQRVARLEREGVIRGYAAVVDPDALGLGLSAFVYLDVEQHAWKTLRHQVLQLPEVVFGALVSGEHDIVLHVRTTDATALRELVLSRLQSMAEVRSTQTVLIFDELSPAGDVVRPHQGR